MLKNYKIESLYLIRHRR